MAGEASVVNTPVEAPDAMGPSGAPPVREERRSAQRTAVTMECEAVLLDQPNHPSTRITLRDISTGGASFDTSHPFRENERLMIVMHLANRTGRSILSRIRYCNKLSDSLHLAGVEFLDAMNLSRSLGPARIPPKWLMPRTDK
ncbi:MAG: PilZ domain-containing protein [Phycisphaerales bacterium]|nr:PilZ domain-containing protein [Phycisphaerales bacterium]